MNSRMLSRLLMIGLALVMLVTAAHDAHAEKVTELSQLEGKVFAVPAGTVADSLVLSMFPNATFLYYDSALDACLAVRSGEADAAAYDEPILRNIAAGNTGLVVLPDLITVDDYGFAVQLGREDMKLGIDGVVSEMKKSGKYDEMRDRWFPKEGAPQEMPDIVYRR